MADVAVYLWVVLFGVTGVWLIAWLDSKCDGVMEFVYGGIFLGIAYWCGVANQWLGTALFGLVGGAILFTGIRTAGTKFLLWISGLLSIGVMVGVAYFGLRKLATIPVNVAIIIGALMIAGAIIASRPR